ncbi:hypothetical protein V1509DRAFT_308082 [Lipomyces kononenkoae]
MDISSPLPPLRPSSVNHSNGPASSTPKPSHVHPRSCTFCRHRKVKCDRQQPCANCVRACHGHGCVYPPGPGRAAKQSRKTLNSELVDRLSRLETIIRRRALPDPETSSTRSVEIDKHSLDTENASSVTSSLDHSSSVDQQLGRLVIDETRSYYISNILWANLGSEIEELRNLLAEPAFEDEDGIYEDISSPPLGSNAAILGFRALAYSLQSYHPPLPESVALLQVFIENVVPMVHIFHIPTTTRMYWDVIARLDSIDKNTEALLFAIYYSAVISMGPEQCINIMGMSREAAIEKYRFAVEQAMARANLLNTQSIILIQAAVLFLSALRNEDDSRTVWSLTSLVFHIAQTMGLHRDGTAFGLKPFETELRRRLWLHICLLDQRSSEYHGGEPIVHEFTFDTKVPLHINDRDLVPEMTTPPPERDGFCDMTFSLIRSEAMRTGWKISHVPPSMRFPGRPPDGLSLKDRQILAEELKDRLHQSYLPHCDNRVPFQLLSLTVARLIIARIWLVVHWPPGGSGILQGDASMRDKLFLTSIEVLEQSSLLLTNKDISKWTWHSV